MSSYICRCGSKFDLLSQLVAHAAGCTAELVKSSPSELTNKQSTTCFHEQIEIIEDVVVASRNYPYIKDAWQTLKVLCTKPTDVQQQNVAIALLKEMVKVWDVHGVIHKDSWYYERANTVIVQNATI